MITLAQHTRAALTALLFFETTGQASAQENCVRLMTPYGMAETVWNKNCSKDSLRVRTSASGFYGTKIRWRICVEQASGNWDCGAGRQESGEPFSYWACKPTGRVVIDVLAANGSEYSGCLPDYNREPPDGFSIQFYSNPNN